MDYPLAMQAMVGAAGREYIFSSLVQLVNAGRRSGHIAASFAEVHTSYASICQLHKNIKIIKSLKN